MKKAAAGVLIVIIAVVLFLKQRKDEAPAPGPAEKETTKVVKETKAPNQTPSGAQFDDRVIEEEDPIGTLRLQGLVLDKDENPVEGAQVTIASVPPRTAETEEDGSFFFDKLVAREYRLVARANVGAADATFQVTGKKDLVIMRLLPGASVTVTVQDRKTKKPVSGATVEVRDISAESLQTDSEGKATFSNLVPGGYQVAAYSPNHARRFSWFGLRPDEQEEITLELDGGARVAGRVVSEEGKPVEGALVSYGNVSEWSQSGNDKFDGVLTSAKGEFEFPAIAAGSFRFSARHSEYSQGTSELVTLDGETEVADVVIEIKTGVTLTGLVQDTNQVPLPGARVRAIQQVEGMMWWIRPKQTYTDDNGKFTLRGLPQGTVKAVAIHETGSSDFAIVQTENTDSASVTLTVDVTGTITGTVVTTKGEPIEGAQVNCMPDFMGGQKVERGEWQLRGFPSDLTDADGRFSLTGLADGNYRVSASVGSEGRRRWMRGRDGVLASPGDTQVKIEIPETSTITGRVLYSNGSAPEMFQVRAGPVVAQGGKDGKFVLENVQPGATNLHITGPEQEPQFARVDVKEGEENKIGTITVRKGMFIAGRVTKNGTAIEGAKVYGGPMIFGNGTEAKSSFGGPPQARGVKEATTDESGNFRLAGLMEARTEIVADHPEHGRSLPVRIPLLNEPITGLSLELLDYGSLQGKVVVEGKPAENVIVNVQSTTSTAVMFGVSTGPDGVYRLDRLAPDTYKVSAMLGQFMTGMAYHATTALVRPKQTTTADLTVEKGTIDLTVSLKPSQPIAFAQIWILEGNVSPKNTGEFMEAQGNNPGFSQSKNSMVGTPVTFDKIQPGTYSLCGIGIPKAVSMQDMGMYMTENFDTMLVTCAPITVAPAPTEQSTELSFDVADYEPPESQTPEE